MADPESILDDSATRAALLEALARLGIRPRGLARARRASRLIRNLPAWVLRSGALSAGGTTWVWYEGRSDVPPGLTGQLVLDLPPGRYLCEVLEVSSGTWCARESAEGGPLVVGLPALEGAGVLRLSFTTCK